MRRAIKRIEMRGYSPVWLFYLGDLEPYHGPTASNGEDMRKTRNALLGILTMMSGAILAVPTDAAERYISGGYIYEAGPERLFSYPYGGTHLRVDYAKRRFGYPYVGPYYGSYYAPGTTTTTAVQPPPIGKRAFRCRIAADPA
jgi:hypothetical protein